VHGAGFFPYSAKIPCSFFFLSGFLPRILALFRWVDHKDSEGRNSYTSPFPWFYDHVCKPIFSDLRNGSLLYAVCMIAFYWLVVYLLDKRRIYIRV